MKGAARAAETVQPPGNTDVAGTGKGKAGISTTRCNSRKNVLPERSVGLGCTEEGSLFQVLPVLQDLIYLRATPST